MLGSPPLFKELSPNLCVGRTASAGAVSEYRTIGFLSLSTFPTNWEILPPSTTVELELFWEFDVDGGVMLLFFPFTSTGPWSVWLTCFIALFRVKLVDFELFVSLMVLLRDCLFLFDRDVFCCLFVVWVWVWPPIMPEKMRDFRLVDEVVGCVLGGDSLLKVLLIDVDSFLVLLMTMSLRWKLDEFAFLVGSSLLKIYLKKLLTPVLNLYAFMDGPMLVLDLWLFLRWKVELD